MQFSLPRTPSKLSLVFSLRTHTSAVRSKCRKIFILPRVKIMNKTSPKISLSRFQPFPAICHQIALVTAGNFIFNRVALIKRDNQRLNTVYTWTWIKSSCSDRKIEKFQFHSVPFIPSQSDTISPLLRFSSACHKRKLWVLYADEMMASGFKSFSSLLFQPSMMEFMCK